MITKEQRIKILIFGCIAMLIGFGIIFATATETYVFNAQLFDVKSMDRGDRVDLILLFNNGSDYIVFEDWDTFDAYELMKCKGKNVTIYVDVYILQFKAELSGFTVNE